jgi:Transposase, Mutator family
VPHAAIVHEHLDEPARAEVDAPARVGSIVTPVARVRRDPERIACVDGLAGFPEAIEAVFPAAWVQTSIVHQIRSSMRYVAFKDRRRVAADLKPIGSRAASGASFSRPTPD